MVWQWLSICPIANQRTVRVECDSLICCLARSHFLRYNLQSSQIPQTVSIKCQRTIKRTTLSIKTHSETAIDSVRSKVHCDIFSSRFGPTFWTFIQMTLCTHNEWSEFDFISVFRIHQSLCVTAYSLWHLIVSRAICRYVDLISICMRTHTSHLMIVTWACKISLHGIPIF